MARPASISAPILVLLLALTSQANVNNSVVYGNVRVTVHTPALLRLEWSSTGTFDDRPTVAFTNRSIGPPPFTFAASGGALVLNTTRLSLRYTGNASFGGDNPRISYELTSGVERTWTPGGPGTVPCGTVAGQDRQDCGVPNPNATTCAAAGCCFDPNVNGTNYDQHVTHCCACAVAFARVSSSPPLPLSLQTGPPSAARATCSDPCPQWTATSASTPASAGTARSSTRASPRGTAGSSSTTLATRPSYCQVAVTESRGAWSGLGRPITRTGTFLGTGTTTSRPSQTLRPSAGRSI